MEVDKIEKGDYKSSNDDTYLSDIADGRGILSEDVVKSFVDGHIQTVFTSSYPPTPPGLVDLAVKVSSTKNGVTDGGLPWLHRVLVSLGLRHYGHQPDVLLSRNFGSLGSCFNIVGNGEISLQLSAVANVSYIEIQHHPHSVTPLGEFLIESKSFVDGSNVDLLKAAWNAAPEGERGGFRDVIRKFPVTEGLPAVDRLTLKLLGKQDDENTCIYRLRVIGRLSPPE